jgi:hypothetical protein
MVKTNYPQVTDEVAQQNAFPVPFTREVFQQDVAEVFLFYVRSMAWMIQSKDILANLPLPSDVEIQDLYMAEFGAKELGLTFEHIRHTEFAVALEQLYDYAYLGREDHSKERIEPDGIHARITCLVLDARDGEMAREWEEWGWSVDSHAARCAQVAETANARVTLEGKEPFFSNFQRSNKDGYLSSEGVTVRQLSLLSGLEAMSIRAAANPKRPNPLKTIVTDQGTRIEVPVALEWLKAKSRYIPITHVWSEADINLATTRFDRIDALDGALQARYRAFCNERSRKELDTLLAQVSIRTGNGIPGPFFDMNEDDFQNEEKVRMVARVLELPIELLVLRAKETLAQENLRTIERALKEATQKV